LPQVKRQKGADEARRAIEDRRSEADPERPGQAFKGGAVNTERHGAGALYRIRRRAARPGTRERRASAPIGDTFRQYATDIVAYSPLRQLTKTCANVDMVTGQERDGQARSIQALRVPNKIGPTRPTTRSAAHPPAGDGRFC
jgi:hypothetical protein